MFAPWNSDPINGHIANSFFDTLNDTACKNRIEHGYHDQKQDYDHNEQRAPCSSRRILGRAERWGPSGRLRGNKASLNNCLTHTSSDESKVDIEERSRCWRQRGEQRDCETHRLITSVLRFFLSSLINWKLTSLEMMTMMSGTWWRCVKCGMKSLNWKRHHDRI